MYASCVLKSKDKRYCDVILKDRVTAYIGRSAETKIKDVKCSKQHIEVIADFSQGTVKVCQRGSNPSEVRDRQLQFGETLTLSHGDSIRLLKHLYKYTVDFTKAINSTENNKRKRSVDLDNKEVKKKSTESTNVDSEDDDRQLRLTQENLSRMQSSLKTFFKPTGEDQPKDILKSEKSQSGSSWQEAIPDKLYVFKTAGVKHGPKVACFDIDGTIICTKSGKVFPTSVSDWMILYSHVPKKLQELSTDGFQIVFFTNQKGISIGNLKPGVFQQKLKDIANVLLVPFQALISSGSGAYRKPITGMWDYFQDSCNSGIEIDMQSSFYVGDAAGRPANWEPKRKKDFSCSDRLFALNCGLQFFTPEEYFLQQKEAPFNLPEFDPRNLKGPLAKRMKPTELELSENNICQKPEVIVFVGFPAAGKSFFAKKYLLPQGYVHVNRDNLGSYQKCLALCDSTLNKGGSVVIDNTNPDQESRKRYIDLAKKHNVSCRCFLFNCNIKHAEHNNAFRDLVPAKKDHASVNYMVLNSYKSKFQEPNLSEGFKEIVDVNFIPCFTHKKHEQLYKMFLTG